MTNAFIIKSIMCSKAVRVTNIVLLARKFYSHAIHAGYSFYIRKLKREKLTRE